MSYPEPANVKTMSLILDTAKISLTCEGDFEYQFDAE